MKAKLPIHNLNCFVVCFNSYIHLSLSFDTVSIRHQSYPGTDVILLCFSIDNPESLVGIELTWSPELQLYCPEGTSISIAIILLLFVLYENSTYIIVL